MLRSIVLSFLGLMAAGASLPSAAATYLVGSDGAACTHTTLQAAIDAAAANPGPDAIVATRSASYVQQALAITTSEDLTITGGYANCITNFSDGLQTDIDGAGGSDASVFRITSGGTAIVRLAYLRIRRGDPSVIDGVGGGIHYSGSGTLEVSNAAIINNFAVKGGGIYANGSVESARLVLGENVSVTGNIARGDGGGVFVNGMLFEMAEANSIIAFNEAQGATGTGYGGGLVIRSTGSRKAVGLVSSGGVGSLGAIYGNEAKRGGGVAISAGGDSNDSAELHLFTRHADQPAAVRGNFASEVGGGLYIWPNRNFSGGDGFAYAYLWRAELTGNASPEGAAAFVDNSDISDGEGPTGGFFYINTARPAGALPCPVDAPCGRIADNVAETANGAATDGAAILLTGNSELTAKAGTLLAGNRAGRLVDARDSDEFYNARVDLADAVIVGNVLGQQLVRGSGNALLAIADTTVADNAIAAPDVIVASRNNVVVRRSIIEQPGRQTLASGSGTPTVAQVIASEAVSLGGGPEAIVAAPRFIDPARGDYRLRAASPAIDFAAPVAGDDRDAYGRPRDQDLPVVPRPDPSRVRDIGAFERQTLQPLVLNGEFAGDANLWFLPVGHVSAYDNDNATGSVAGSGSVRVSGTTADGRLLGLAQCIHVPGPGLYALNGWSHSTGSPSQRNPLGLVWELRADGGEGCIDGPIVASATHFLPGGGAWGTSAQPTLISVPESMWNHNTSITILLAVLPNAIDASFNGWFDRISLEVTTAAPLPDALFSNGYE